MNQNIFWGNTEDVIIRVKNSISEKNLNGIKEMYPNALIIKENTLHNICKNKKSKIEIKSSYSSTSQEISTSTNYAGIA